MSEECENSPKLPYRNPLYDGLKRLLDLLAGLALLVIFSPLLLLIALMIRRSSPGSVLYRQVRVGRDERSFYVYKFRTMYADADQHGPLITSSDDARVTPLGRFLRGTKLDELPQLINVIKGDMSLVGPRPQVPRFVKEFRPDHRAIVLSVRPGITGPTQLKFCGEEEMLKGVPDRERYYIETLLPTKCQIDIDYVQRRSLTVDINVLLETCLLFARATSYRATRRRPRPQHVQHIEYTVADTFRDSKEEVADVELIG